MEYTIYGFLWIHHLRLPVLISTTHLPLHSKNIFGKSTFCMWLSPTLKYGRAVTHNCKFIALNTSLPPPTAHFTGFVRDYISKLQIGFYSTLVVSNGNYPHIKWMLYNMLFHSKFLVVSARLPRVRLLHMPKPIFSILPHVFASISSNKPIQNDYIFGHVLFRPDSLYLVLLILRFYLVFYNPTTSTLCLICVQLYK